jgi:phosphoadenosine phosphosulfate reductase
MTLAANPIQPSDPLDLDALNSLFESADPAKIVEWSAAQFGDELLMSSSFGAESAMLIHLAIQRRPDIRIVFVDTGYLFPETFAHLDALRTRFDLNVRIYRTLNDPLGYLQRAGEDELDWRKNIDRCCAENKNEPFDRAMRELAPKGWLRGIRRNQADTRKARQFIEWSPRYRCYSVSPLLNLSTKDIFGYMKRHDLPYHPLYDQGYLSIGCNPLSCTRPVTIGDDPRSGRWAGSSKVECGLNVDVTPPAARP